MAYKYSPPRGYAPGVTRNEIQAEIKRWNDQAGSVVITDFDLPMMKAGVIEAECRLLLRGQPVTVKVGKWEDFATNLRCCYLIIRDMRLGEARGSLDAMRAALLMLPSGPKAIDPWELLGIRPGSSLARAEAAYRIKAKEAHPDAGGSEERMKELNDALARVKAEVHE